MRILSAATSAVLWSILSVITTAEEQECGLYLATSSTSDSDAHRWGVYAGMNIPKNSVIGEPEIAIQTHNLMGNAHLPEKDMTRSEVMAVSLFEEYIWVADSTAGKRELGGQGRIVTAIPGAGVLGGFNEKLTNADWDHAGAYFKTPLAESKGEPHVGRGASSHFYNVTLRAKEAIKAGSEIFLDYGENWGEDDDDENESELNKKDYERIDILVNQMVEFFDKYKEELTSVAKAEIYEFLIRDIVNAAAGPQKAKTIYMLLPKSPDELVEIGKAGGALQFSQPSSRRSLDWLQQNGRCMDHLRMGESKIPSAGRGAFAKRKIKKGGLVSPIPLIPIPDKKVMDMHEIVKSTGGSGEKFYHRANEEVIGQQLLLNYCYGHPESKMLLFPAGSMSSFINHSSEKPNAKMQWSTHPEHQSGWLQLTPEMLLGEEYAYVGLLMEIVALRDIEEGEEILMDYGKEWEAAWNAHVKAWTKKVKDGALPNPWPTRAADMTQEYKSKPFPTIAEGITHPDDVRQMCFLVVREVKSSPGLKQWTIPSKGVMYDDENLFDCRIVERTELNEEVPGSLPYNYTVEWFDDDNEKDDTKVIDVPHEAIVFVDKPFKSDQFVMEAFRHEIGIPDDVFPKGPWRNLK